MLPAFGNDYVPGILAGTLAAKQAGEAARSLDVGYFVDGSLRGGKGLSQGTRKTVMEGLTRPVTVWADRRLRDERAAHEVRSFTIDGRKRAAVLATGTEVLFLPPHFPRLDSLSVYNGWFSEISRLVQVTSAVANLAVRTRAGARFVHFVNERMEGAPGGPDEKERARSRAHTVAVARDSSGSILSEIHVKGPSVYDLTAELMAWAADELAHGRGQTPGVVGPIEAFGLETLVDACRTIGLAVV